MVDLSKYWRDSWAPPDRRSIPEWARENIDLQGDYAEKGFFRVENSRYLNKAFEFIANDTTRQLNLLKAVQTGGSLVGDISLQHWFANDPNSTQLIFQTDDDADQHFRARVQPTFEHSPCNKSLFKQHRKKRDFWQFPHMNLYVHGANWSSLQRKSIKYQINDECWQWPSGMLEEAWGRTRAFKATCKILNISQAGTQDDEWNLTCDNAKRYDYGVNIPGAGKTVPLEFFLKMENDPENRAGIIWDSQAKNADGSYDYDKVRKTTRFKCPITAKEYEDTPRNWALFNEWGSYICKDEERTIREVTLRWNSLVRGYWGDLAVQYCRALEALDKGLAEPLKKFYQKELCIPWAEDMETPEVRLISGGYEEGEPWEDSVFDCMTVDYQEGKRNEGEHFWVCVRAWAADGRSRLRYFGKVWTADEIEVKREEYGINPVFVGIDGGDQLTYIAGICARFGYIILEGAGNTRTSFPHKKGKGTVYKAYAPKRRVDPLRGKRGAKRKIAWSFMWSNYSVKNILWRLRHGLGKEWALYDNLPESYVSGIDSEIKKRVTVKRTGGSQFIWYRTNRENHPWDCEAMSVVMAMIRGIIVFDPGNKPDDSDAKQEKQKAANPAAPHTEPDQPELFL